VRSLGPPQVAVGTETYNGFYSLDEIEDWLHLRRDSPEGNESAFLSGAL